MAVALQKEQRESLFTNTVGDCDGDDVGIDVVTTGETVGAGVGAAVVQSVYVAGHDPLTNATQSSTVGWRHGFVVHGKHSVVVGFSGAAVVGATDVGDTDVPPPLPVQSM